MTLSSVIPTAAKMEFSATAFFSRRMLARLVGSAIGLIIHVPGKSGKGRARIVDAATPARGWGQSLPILWYDFHSSSTPPPGGNIPEENH